jgi:hypothetical protein
MLKIQDKNGKLKFVLDDESEQPLSVDDVVLNGTEEEEEEEEKTKKPVEVN